MVRRISVLLALLTQTASVPVLCERWGLSPSCLYDWQKEFMVCGMDSLIARHSGGRPEKLTPRQKKRLVELIEAGPLVVGFETACRTAVLIRVLIWREFGILDNRHYVCTWHCPHKNKLQNIVQVSEVATGEASIALDEIRAKTLQRCPASPPGLTRDKRRYIARPDNEVSR